MEKCDPLSQRISCEALHFSTLFGVFYGCTFVFGLGKDLEIETTPDASCPPCRAVGGGTAVMENEQPGWDVVVMPRRHGGGQSCAFSPEPKLSWFFEKPQVLP